MINKKIVGCAALAFPFGILALEALYKAVCRGLLEPTVASVVFEGVLVVLAFPVVIYNHFTQVNQGPLNLTQVALLVLSGLIWGLLIERIVHWRKGAKAA